MGSQLFPGGVGSAASRISRLGLKGAVACGQAYYLIQMSFWLHMIVITVRRCGHRGRSMPYPDRPVPHRPSLGIER